MEMQSGVVASRFKSRQAPLALILAPSHSAASFIKLPELPTFVAAFGGLVGTMTHPKGGRFLELFSNL